MLLGTLGASLFGKLLAGKDVTRGGKRMIKEKQHRNFAEEDRIFNATLSSN